MITGPGEGRQQHCLDMRFYGSAMRFPHVQGGFRDVSCVDCAPFDPARIDGGWGLSIALSTGVVLGPEL